MTQEALKKIDANSDKQFSIDELNKFLDNKITDFPANEDNIKLIKKELEDGDKTELEKTLVDNLTSAKDEIERKSFYTTKEEKILQLYARLLGPVFANKNYSTDYKFMPNKVSENIELSNEERKLQIETLLEAGQYYIQFLQDKGMLQAKYEGDTPQHIVYYNDLQAKYYSGAKIKNDEMLFYIHQIFPDISTSGAGYSTKSGKVYKEIDKILTSKEGWDRKGMKDKMIDVLYQIRQLDDAKGIYYKSTDMLLSTLIPNIGKCRIQRGPESWKLNNSLIQFDLLKPLPNGEFTDPDVAKMYEKLKHPSKDKLIYKTTSGAQAGGISKEYYGDSEIFATFKKYKLPSEGASDQDLYDLQLKLTDAIKPIVQKEAIEKADMKKKIVDAKTEEIKIQNQQKEILKNGFQKQNIDLTNPIAEQMLDYFDQQIVMNTKFINGEEIELDTRGDDKKTITLDMIVNEQYKFMGNKLMSDIIQKGVIYEVLHQNQKITNFIRSSKRQGIALTSDEKTIDMLADITGAGSRLEGGYFSDATFNTAVEVSKELAIQVALIAISGGIANVAAKGTLLAIQGGAKIFKVGSYAARVARYTNMSKTAFWSSVKLMPELFAADIIAEGTIFHLANTTLNAPLQGLSVDEYLKTINPFGSSSNAMGYVESIAFMGVMKSFGSITNAITKELGGKTLNAAQQSKTIKNVLTANLITLPGEVAAMQGTSAVVGITFGHDVDLTPSSRVHALAMVIGLRISHMATGPVKNLTSDIEAKIQQNSMKQGILMMDKVMYDKVGNVQSVEYCVVDLDGNEVDKGIASNETVQIALKEKVETISRGVGYENMPLGYQSSAVDLTNQLQGEIQIHQEYVHPTGWDYVKLEKRSFTETQAKKLFEEYKKLNPSLAAVTDNYARALAGISYKFNVDDIAFATGEYGKNFKKGGDENWMNAYLKKFKEFQEKYNFDIGGLMLSPKTMERIAEFMDKKKSEIPKPSLEVQNENSANSDKDVPKIDLISIGLFPEQERNSAEIKDSVDAINETIAGLNKIDTANVETIKIVENTINNILEKVKNFSSLAKNIIFKAIDDIRNLINYKSGKEINEFIETELATNPDKYCTDIDIIKRGLQLFEQIGYKEAKSSGNMHHLKEVLLGTHPSGGFSVSKLEMENILKNIDYKNDFLIIEKDKNLGFGMDGIEFINLRAAQKVIQQNSDIFPAEAVENPAKRLEENYGTKRSSRGDALLMQKRYGLLSGFPRNSTDKYVVFDEFANKYPTQLVELNLLKNTRRLSKDAIKLKIDVRIESKKGFIEEIYLKLIEEGRNTDENAILFGEQDIQQRLNLLTFNYYKVRKDPKNNDSESIGLESSSPLSPGTDLSNPIQSSPDIQMNKSDLGYKGDIVYEGKNIGHFSVSIENGIGYLSDIQIGYDENSSNIRNHGIGTSAYIEIINKLHENGIILQSTNFTKSLNSISPQALAIWKKLADLGYAKVIGDVQGKIHDRFTGEDRVDNIPIYESIAHSNKSEKSDSKPSLEVQNENSMNSDKLIDADGTINPDAKAYLESFLRDQKALGAQEILTDGQVRKIYEVHNMKRNPGENDDTKLNVRKGLALRELFTAEQIRVLMEGRVCGKTSENEISPAEKDFIDKMFRLGDYEHGKEIEFINSKGEVVKRNVSAFNMEQQTGNCYMIAEINAIRNNPMFAQWLYQSVEYIKKDNPLDCVWRIKLPISDPDGKWHEVSLRELFSELEEGKIKEKDIDVYAPSEIEIEKFIVGLQMKEQTRLKKKSLGKPVLDVSFEEINGIKRAYISEDIKNNITQQIHAKKGEYYEEFKKYLISSERYFAVNAPIGYQVLEGIISKASEGTDGKVSKIAMEGGSSEDIAKLLLGEGFDHRLVGPDIAIDIDTLSIIERGKISKEEVICLNNALENFNTGRFILTCSINNFKSETHGKLYSPKFEYQNEDFCKGHAYSIIGYDKSNRIIKVVNPWDNNKILDMPYDTFFDIFDQVEISERKLQSGSNSPLSPDPLPTQKQNAIDYVNSLGLSPETKAEIAKAIEAIPADKTFNSSVEDIVRRSLEWNTLSREAKKASIEKDLGRTITDVQFDLIKSVHEMDGGLFIFNSRENVAKRDKLMNKGGFSNKDAMILMEGHCGEIVIPKGRFEAPVERKLSPETEKLYIETIDDITGWSDGLFNEIKGKIRAGNKKETLIKEYTEKIKKDLHYQRLLEELSSEDQRSIDNIDNNVNNFCNNLINRVEAFDKCQTGYNNIKKRFNDNKNNKEYCEYIFALKELGENPSNSETYRGQKDLLLSGLPDAFQNLVKNDPLAGILLGSNDRFQINKDGYLDVIDIEFVFKGSAIIVKFNDISQFESIYGIDAAGNYSAENGVMNIRPDGYDQSGKPIFNDKTRKHELGHATYNDFGFTIKQKKESDQMTDLINSTKMKKKVEELDLNDSNIVNDFVKDNIERATQNAVDEIIQYATHDKEKAGAIKENLKSDSYNYTKFLDFLIDKYRSHNSSNHADKQIHPEIINKKIDFLKQRKDLYNKKIESLCDLAEMAERLGRGSQLKMTPYNEWGKIII